MALESFSTSVMNRDLGTVSILDISLKISLLAFRFASGVTLFQFVSAPVRSAYER